MAPLQSFEQARCRTGALNRRPPRVVPIPVRCVVGSVDEAKRAALRPDFLPRRAGVRAARYQAVYRAMRAEIPLPAIEVYGLGGTYYVLDGHHRVAAARALGLLYLDALVHEFVLPDAARGTVREQSEAARRGGRPGWWPTMAAAVGGRWRRRRGVQARVAGGESPCAVL